MFYELTPQQWDENKELLERHFYISSAYSNSERRSANSLRLKGGDLTPSSLTGRVPFEALLAIVADKEEEYQKQQQKLKQQQKQKREQMSKTIKKYIKWGVLALIAIIAIVHVFMSIKTIEAGQVGVLSLFGKVDSDVLPEGMHFTTPYAKVTSFDAKQKTRKESIGVPSQDQLVTTFELSVQYRLIKEKAATMFKETGSPDQVVEVHMIPKLRSKLRELGKTVKTAEDFYLSDTQVRIQEELLTELSGLSEQGIKVTELLIRSVTLPTILIEAVARKKKAAQEAETAKEELKKFKVEQDKKETQALAEKTAAIIDAEKVAEVAKTLAQGNLEADKINAQAVVVKAEAEKEAKQLIIEAVGIENYIKLESLKVLPAFQDGNHVIIMDPNDVNPLPFMNLGK